VSSETSFALKQPKLEPKLVSALSETKHLFRLFRFFTETASFGVSIEPKQKNTNRNKPKQKIVNSFKYRNIDVRIEMDDEESQANWTSIPIPIETKPQKLGIWSRK